MNKSKKKLDDLFYIIFKIPKNKNKKNVSHKNVKRWDSLSHVSLILAIESKFNIKIKPEDSIELTSYKKILNFIKNFQGKNLWEL